MVQVLMLFNMQINLMRLILFHSEIMFPLIQLIHIVLNISINQK